jgi:hypothetical protein
LIASTTRGQPSTGLLQVRRSPAGTRTCRVGCAGSVRSRKDPSHRHRLCLQRQQLTYGVL